MRTAFISGHVDISDEEFETHYIPLIDKAISEQDSFIMGNALGVDKKSLIYIRSQGVAEDWITIYFYHRRQDQIEAIKNQFLYSGLRFIEGFSSYEERDAAMTANSDYDIAWVRSEEASKALYGDKYRPNRISGTQKNIERRKKK